MAVSRHRGFDPTENNAVRFTVPENPTLEQNTTDDALLRYGHWKFSEMCEWAGLNGRSIGRQYSYFLH